MTQKRIPREVIHHGLVYGDVAEVDRWKRSRVCLSTSAASVKTSFHRLRFGAKTLGDVRVGDKKCLKKETGGEEQDRK